jgi:hypothetical protein
MTATLISLFGILLSIIYIFLCFVSVSSEYKMNIIL